MPIIQAIASSTPNLQWTKTGSIFGDISLGASNLYDWLANSYVYRGVETPPSYKGPAAPSTIPQMQGDWTPTQALEQGWGTYQTQLKDFFTQQAVRNDTTTPSLVGLLSLPQDLATSLTTLLIVGGAVLGGFILVDTIRR
jgi:hypothetical protein